MLLITSFCMKFPTDRLDTYQACINACVAGHTIHVNFMKMKIKEMDF